MSSIKKIATYQTREHRKASERYVDVCFKYNDGFEWEGSIPVEYRRTGTDLTTKKDIKKHIEKCYDFCNPANLDSWRNKQKEFWKDKKSGVTKKFFDQLQENFSWTCVSCSLPPNPNFARRVQDLKEQGYTIATNTKKFCPNCNKNNTHLILVPLPRGGVSGYEIWDSATRNKIIKVLELFDAYEGKAMNTNSLLPDHKFPEIRWDSKTKRDSLKNLTETDIKRDFQLMTNQRNQQKREACRKCYQEGKRGFPFGIKYYYEGSESWNTKSKQGKVAEAGCIGCGWYDLSKWRNSLIHRLSSS